MIRVLPVESLEPNHPAKISGVYSRLADAHSTCSNTTIYQGITGSFCAKSHVTIIHNSQCARLVTMWYVQVLLQSKVAMA